VSTTHMVSTETPLSARELRARQVVLAAGTLDAWRAKFERYATRRDERLASLAGPTKRSGYLRRGRRV
jgi:hypothetical protein